MREGGSFFFFWSTPTHPHTHPQRAEAFPAPNELGPFIRRQPHARVRRGRVGNLPADWSSDGKGKGHIQGSGGGGEERTGSAGGRLTN